MSRWIQRRAIVRTNARPIELRGRELPVTGKELGGSDREQAWLRMAATQPRIAKYQAKSDREYPVIRRSPR